MCAAERERHSTAQHEAGHAVMAAILGVGLTRVSIEPASGTQGQVTYAIPAWITKGHPPESAVRRWCEANIMSQMAGFIAEKHFLGRANHVGATADYAGTWEMANLISLSQREAELYLDALFERTATLMKKRVLRRAVSRIAEALLLESNLTRRQVQRIVHEVIA